MKWHMLGWAYMFLLLAGVMEFYNVKLYIKEQEATQARGMLQGYMRTAGKGFNSAYVCKERVQEFP